MHCPEDEDYIYLGGVFRNFTRYTNTSLAADQPYNLSFYDFASSYSGDKLNSKELQGTVTLWETHVADPYHDVNYEPTVVNNFVKLNVNTFEIEPVMVNSISKQDQPGVLNVNETSSDSPAVVRTIFCSSDNGTTCETMYIGGLFTHVYGTKVRTHAQQTRVQPRPPPQSLTPLSSQASGLAKLTRSGGETTVEEVLDVRDTGIIMDVSTYADWYDSPLVVVGMFGPEDSDDKKGTLEVTQPGVAIEASVQYIYAGGRVKCVISTDMMSMDQCRRPNAPENCCEKIVGPAHAVEHVAHDEVVVGGSFSVSGTMKFDPAGDAPEGGVPSQGGGGTPPGGGGSTPSSSSDGEMTSSSEAGYQNFQRLFVPRLTASSRIDNKHAEEMREKGKLTGGPNGEVMDIKCIKKEDEFDKLTNTTGWRCTELLVSGRFDSWEAFFWNETTMVAELNETGTVPCNQGVAKLHYDPDTTLYTPVHFTSQNTSIVISREEYNAKSGKDYFDYSTTSENPEDEEDYPSVNVVYLSKKGSIYGGGEFARFNNIFELNNSHFTPLGNLAESTFGENTEFYDCNGLLANETNRQAMWGGDTSGTDFCCR